LADPAHPDHAEHSACVADVAALPNHLTQPFVDIPAVNRALAAQF
jgi:hypothetical protein